MKKMDFAEAKRVAACLDKAFDIDRHYLLSEAGAIFKNEGIDYKEYGFFKCIDFLKAFPCFTFTSKDLVPETYVMYCGYPSNSKLTKFIVDMSNRNSVENYYKDYDLFDFVFFPPCVKQFLAKLAALVLPESWSFPEGEDNYEILAAYLNYTYKRLRFEKKIWFNQDHSEAIMNTGLVNNRYEDIFIRFEKNEREGAQPYVAKEILDQSTSLKQVAKMPERAKFYSYLGELVYDRFLPIDISYDHIILTHLERFPLAFLERKLASNEKAVAICKMLALGVSDSNSENLWNDLKKLIRNDPFLYCELKAAIDRAVQLAYKKLETNYREVLPCYYPKRAKMAFLLPLNLSDMNTVDLVLVIQPCGGKNVGVTVFTKVMAYVKARLISSMEAGWLCTDNL